MICIGCFHLSESFTFDRMSQPVPSFSDFKLNKQLLTAVAEAGFVTPTAVQQKTIPLILAGHDLTGVSQTGTGKTAAYLLPMLMKIKFAEGDAPRGLILVPTRELALQVKDQISLLAKYTDLRYAAVYGGTGMKSQVEALQGGVDIVVATPGRFLDLYLAGHLVVRKIKTFVMDEAERLLDMGFKWQINRILEIVPKKRQNVLFSATMSDNVKKVAADFLDMPMEINITPESRTAKTVSQVLYYVPNLKTKINLLDFMLTDPELSRVIVFCKTKNAASNIYKYLARKYSEEQVRVIHGNKDQNTRINSINAFKEGLVRLLVTTDVAARGIDVTEVSHVINFDVPVVYEDYIHRIGRTGRAFHTGKSITFCSPNDEYHIKKIQKLIGGKLPVEELPSGVKVEATEAEENQLMLREIDLQKRKEDPAFQGAFHQKKRNIKENSSHRRSSR